MFRVSLYVSYFCWTTIKFGYYNLHTSLWSIHFVAAGKLVQLQFPRAFGLFSKCGSRSPSTVLTRRLQKRLISQQIHVKGFGAYICHAMWGWWLLGHYNYSLPGRDDGILATVIALLHVGMMLFWPEYNYTITGGDDGILARISYHVEVMVFWPL